MHKRAGIGWLMLFLLLGCGRKNEQIGAGENGAIPEKPAGSCFRQVGLITLETIVPVNRIKMADGKFFVSDRKNRMRVFQLDGRLLATFCSSGEGPGELKHLVDFLISGEQVAVADLAKKLVYFDHFGRLIRENRLEINDRGTIHGLLTVDGELCCVTRCLIQQESQNQGEYHFRIQRLSDQKILFSVEDDTVQHNPESRVRLPYLVRPYPNRKLFIQMETGEAVILAAREKTFYLWKGGQFVAVPFSFELRAEPVSQADRCDFFRQMKEVNSEKIARDIERYVEFPKSKENFMGAIPWDGRLALLKRDRILIVGLDGSLVRELDWPQDFGGWSYWDFFYPEQRIQFYGKRLYYLNEEEALQVFELTGPPTGHRDF